MHISEKKLSRGEERPDSDVDLWVKLDYSQPIGLKYFSMMTDLEQKSGRKGTKKNRHSQEGGRFFLGVKE